MSAFELVPERYTEYLALRQRMLVEEPAAFLSSPTDDIAQGLADFTELMAREHNDIFVAESQGRLVATAGVVRQQREKIRHRAHIWGVFCEAPERGNGFGRASVSACIERARTWEGVSVVSLSVSASGGPALALYESLGFVKWGTEPDAIRVGGVAYDEHHLTLPL